MVFVVYCVQCMVRITYHVSRITYEARDLVFRRLVEMKLAVSQSPPGGGMSHAWNPMGWPTQVESMPRWWPHFFSLAEYAYSSYIDYYSYRSSTGPRASSGSSRTEDIAFR